MQGFCKHSKTCLAVTSWSLRQIFPSTGAAEMRDRTKEMQLHRRQHTLLWSVPATLLPLSKLNKPNGEHTPKQSFHDAFTAQQCLKQGHLKSPGWSTDSSFQPPLIQLCLRQQWALSPRPAQAGMLFHRMHTTRWQDTQPNLNWGGEGRMKHYFLGMLFKRQYPHPALLAG